MKTLQTLDQLLGRVACSAVQPLLWARRARGLDRRARAPEEAERVLLIKFWGIGSLQLATPAVRELRRRHPRARLSLLTLAENEGFARGLEGPDGRDAAFDEILTLDVQVGGARLFARLASALIGLRRHRFDAVYDLEFFTRFSAIAALATGAPARHGFHAPGIWRGGIHTRTVPFNRYWHVARNFLALAGGEAEGEVESSELLAHRVPAARDERVREQLERLGLTSPLVVLNPNAGRLSLERRWPPERFTALAERLVRERGASVALIGAPSERLYTEAIHERVPEPARARVVSLAGRQDMAELCALLARAALVVSNDSGPMHIAAALGAPTIGLFGPETPQMYRPLGPRALALWAPPICSPCINVHDNKRATCTHGQPECLMRIEVERVFEAATRMLDTSAPSGSGSAGRGTADRGTADRGTTDRGPRGLEVLG